MFGYSLSGQIIILFIVVIMFVIPVVLGRRLCKKKGFNQNWAWFAIASPGITYLVIGMIKANPEYQSDNEIKWSKIAIIAGIVLAILQILGVFYCP
jgi:hypothetical protein